MKIYGIDNTELLDVKVTSSAQHEEEMGKSDFVRLSWKSNVKYKLQVGTYIVPFEDGLKYRLIEPYEPTQDAEDTFTYQPEFQHPIMWLSKVPFTYATKNTLGEDVVQQEWEYTGQTLTLLQVVVDFINTAFGFADTEKFSLTPVGSIDTNVSVSFSSTDVLSAISSIASACKENKCEYCLSWKHKALYFGQVNVNLGEEIPTLKVGENVGKASVSESSDGYYNVFYPQGSTRNMSVKAASGENVSTGIRLGLDKTKYPNGEIDTRTNANEPKQTLALTFDDIYPHVNCYVYNVRSRTRYLLDDNGDRVVSKYNADGSVKEYKKYTVWYMRLAYPLTKQISGKTPVATTTETLDGKTQTLYWYDYVVEDSQIIDGYTLCGSFSVNTNDGALASSLVAQPSNSDGFELIFHKTAQTISANSTTGDSGVSILAGDFEIVFVNQNETIIPTNEAEGLIPRGPKTPATKGNIVILYNIAMGDDEVTAAQDELEEKTLAEIAYRQSDLKNYTFSAYPNVWAKNDPKLYIGQRVVYNDGNGYSYTTRVMKLVTNLDYDIVQEITVGNAIIKGNVSQLKDDVQGIINGTVAIGSGLSNSQVTEIVKNYVTSRFLSRLRDDIASGVITFSAGLKIIDSLIDTLRKKGETLSGSDTAVLSEAKLIEAFLRKDQDDSTPYNITAGSLTSDRVTSTNYNSGETDGTGWGMTVDSETGKSRLEVDNLLVRMKAVFQELEIRKRTYTGGNVILSGAGSQIAAVVALNKDGLLLSGLNLFSDSTGYYIYIGSSFLAVGSDKVASGTDSQDAYTYRCYILADDGTTRTRNLWQVGDQAICQTFNIEEGHHDGVQNRYYWRLVTGVSAEAVELDDGTYYDYVDLAAVEAPEVTIDGATKTYQGYDTSTMTDGSGNAPKEGTTGDVWVDTPQKGDQIVQLGSQVDPDTRGNAILLDTMGTDAPSIKEYAGINSFSLSGCLRTKLSPAGNLFLAEYLKIISTSNDTTGVSLANYINTTYDKSDIESALGDLEGAINKNTANITANKTAADNAISAVDKKAGDAQTAAEKAQSDAKDAGDSASAANATAEAAKTAADNASTRVEQVNTSVVNFSQGTNEVLSATFGVTVGADGKMVGEPVLQKTSGLVTKPTGSGLIYLDDEGNSAAMGITKRSDGTTAYIKAKDIALEGYTTVNKNFSIDEEGNMSANNANIKGTIEAESGTFRGYLRSAVETIDTTVAPFNDNNVKCYLVSDNLNLLAKNPCCIYLPCDEKYIGARVIIVSTPAFMSNGTFTGDADTAMVRIYAGRTYTDTLYWNASDDNFLADETAAYKTKSAYNSCYHFLGWSYIQDNIHYLPEGIELWNGYIELLGVPAVATDGQTFNKITNTDLSDYVTINADGTISETTAFSADKLTHSTEAATFCQWMVIGHTAAEFHYLDDTNKNLN